MFLRVNFSTTYETRTNINHVFFLLVNNVFFYLPIGVTLCLEKKCLDTCIARIPFKKFVDLETFEYYLNCFVHCSDKLNKKSQNGAKSFASLSFESESQVFKYNLMHS